MTEVTRIQPGPRMSQAVTHGGLVILAGQVADDRQGDVASQTTQVLAKIDRLLVEAGSSKAMLLSVTVWLADIDTFDQMNAVWDEWVDRRYPPARATVEARLALPEFLVEMQAIAARGAAATGQWSS